jgi:hypothetical protein
MCNYMLFLKYPLEPLPNEQIQVVGLLDAGSPAAAEGGYRKDKQARPPRCGVGRSNRLARLANQISALT